MDALKNIVVGVDFSPCSEKALQEAVRIGLWKHTPVHVYHIVYDEMAAELRRAAGVPLSDVHRAGERRLQEFVEAAVAQQDAGEVALHAEFRIGHPFYEIIRAVEKHDADLLVLGSHGQSHADNRVTGILATKCVRKAPCEVLLVREAREEKFHNVVVAVDFSPNARLALHLAARIVRQDGGRLHVVHVYSPPWMHLLQAGEIDSLSVSEEKREQYLQEIRSRLADFTYDCFDEFSGLEAKTEVIEKVSVSSGLIEYLNGVAADLAVLGTRGQTELNVLIIGSTAEQIVRDSPCSVLTVKPEGFAYHPGG